MFATSACICAARSCGVLQAAVANARHSRVPAVADGAIADDAVEDEDRGRDISPP
jgi:hypothetical protein